MESHLPADSLIAAPIGVVAGSAPDGPGKRARAEAGPGLYVHVPFCATRCEYCDFSSGQLSAATVGRYEEALGREMARRAPGVAGVRFRSVFFGGGTPSALSARHLSGIVARLRSHFVIDRDAEFTLEVNPENAGNRLLETWRMAGVNRLSFGVQSFDDRELEGLGRLHDAERPAAAFALARAHGFERLSLDLMFGFPGQTLATWSDTIERALELEPEHVSAYAFLVEAGTPLGNAVLRGEAQVLDADAQADAYAGLTDRLLRAGFGCYETSNFCRPDAESRHNLGYWLRRPYLGLGPSAHGLIGGERYANHWSLERWAADVERGLDPESERERETDESRGSEIVMLGLRLGTGLVASDYSGETWEGVVRTHGAALEQAVRAGRLERAPAGYRIRPQNRFVADDIIGWVEARAARFDTGAAGPIIPSPCPNPPSQAA
jgi:oxygen-independent coproporphyrinogen-3 oxidase